MLAAASALTSILVASTLIAQTPPAAGSGTVIPPVVWQLVEMTASSNDPLEIAGPERYTAQFQTKETVSARAGCNRVAGTYSAGESALDISFSVSTLALCPSDTHGEPFLELLDCATGFEMDLGGMPRCLSRPADYTPTFMPDGKPAIHAGCVRTLGTYATGGPTLDIAVSSSSQAECRPGTLAERFLHDLGDVFSHVFRDGTLYLALRTDAGILAFAAPYDEQQQPTPQVSPFSAEPA